MSNQAYKARVEASAKKRDGSPIYNGSVEHARIIVENMFSHAHNHVDILTGTLNARVYGAENVVAEANLFLANPEHSLRVLLEDVGVADLADHPLYEAVGSQENVEFRVVPSSLKASYDYHFMVMDGDSYRFESDRTQCVAVAAWGDTKGATNLKRIFDVLWGEEEMAPAPQPEVALR